VTTTTFDAPPPTVPLRLHVPCENAAFVVTIDGRPYAGFVSRAYAEMAVALWSGEIDGKGDRIPFDQRSHCGWAAARGRHFEIVDR